MGPGGAMQLEIGLNGSIPPKSEQVASFIVGSTAIVPPCRRFQEIALSAARLQLHCSCTSPASKD